MTVELCPLKKRSASSSGPGVKLEPPDENFVHVKHEECAISLAQRESELVQREHAVLSERGSLTNERARVKQLEKDASRRLEAVKTDISSRTLSLVEDKLTCALCLEMLACPYVLNPPFCGHTYCAECILKCFFSALHDDCGCWHENVTCPVCRCLLPYTKYEVPRSASLIPFSPNRALDKFMSGVVDHLVKSGVSEWKRSGKQYNDWMQRNQNGREFMRDLFTRWETCTAAEFLGMKRSLSL